MIKGFVRFFLSNCQVIYDYYVNRLYNSDQFTCSVDIGLGWHAGDNRCLSFQILRVRNRIDSNLIGRLLLHFLLLLLLLLPLVLASNKKIKWDQVRRNHCNINRSIRSVSDDPHLLSSTLLLNLLGKGNSISINRVICVQLSKSNNQTNAVALDSFVEIVHLALIRSNQITLTGIVNSFVITYYSEIIGNINEWFFLNSRTISFTFSYYYLP